METANEHLIELTSGVMVQFYETKREQRVAIDAGRGEIDLSLEDFVELIAHPEIFTEAMRRADLPCPIRVN